MAGCFAYNTDGLRCDSPAGHDGPHTLTIEWGDEECWVPSAGSSSNTPLSFSVNLAAPLPEEESLGPVPIYGEGKPGVCVLCNHAMHGRECERCDCKSGIPG